tara:strand:- start:794 stop:1396 length:603 start_codon:yes stop_codon:yes gene_type:complete
MAKTVKKDNLLFWNSVQTTDPKYTKEVGFGRKFTSINAQYQVRELTRAFGLMGSGWGITNEKFFTLEGIGGLVCYTATLWYELEGKRNEYDINSSIAAFNKAGKMDDECFKKVSTDALTKGLSKLGFNSDIFLGMWDDNRYVNQVTEKFKTKVALAQTQLDAMIGAIKAGQGNIVKSKMGDYSITKEQSLKLETAFNANP